MTTEQQEQAESTNESLSRQYAEATGIPVGTHVDDPDGNGLPDYEPKSFGEAGDDNDAAVEERNKEALEAYVDENRESGETDDQGSQGSDNEPTDPDGAGAPEVVSDEVAAESDTLTGTTTGIVNPDAAGLQGETVGFKGISAQSDEAPAS